MPPCHLNPKCGRTLDSRLIITMGKDEWTSRKLCADIVQQRSSMQMENTSNMHKIFAPGTILTWQHHPGVTVTAAKWKKVVQTVQTQLPTLFNQPLHLSGNSERANAITRSIGVFIASDLREAMKTPIDYQIHKLWFKLRLQLHFYLMIDIYIYENFRALESCRNIFFKPLKFTYSLFTYQLKEPRLSINTGFFINFMLGLLENCSSIFFIFVTHFICMFHTDS